MTLQVTIGVLVGMMMMLQLQLFSVSARSTVFQTSVSQLHHEQQQQRHGDPHLRSHSRKLSTLVEPSPLLLNYHNGPILTGRGSGIHVYIVWYGQFSESQRAAITDFFGSFSSSSSEGMEPSVRSWWKVTEAYRDARGASVASQVLLRGQVFDDQYSKGKTLSKRDIQDIVEVSVSSSGSVSEDPSAIYFVLTAEDVQVGTFCMNTCGSHHFTAPTQASKNQQLLYAWVGNSASKCAGRCAWPFAKPQYGPQTEPLVAPNADVGIDGMLINIATLLAGTATNPYSNAYFQGDASAPLEAATSCSGMYGEGAFPGYPGSLLVDQTTGASYNSVGLNGRQFLLPALWDPTTLSCRVVYSLTVDLVVTDQVSGLSDSQ